MNRSERTAISTGNGGIRRSQTSHGTRRSANRTTESEEPPNPVTNSIVASSVLGRRRKSRSPVSNFRENQRIVAGAGSKADPFTVFNTPTSSFDHGAVKQRKSSASTSTQGTFSTVPDDMPPDRGGDRDRDRGRRVKAKHTVAPIAGTFQTPRSHTATAMDTAPHVKKEKTRSKSRDGQYSSHTQSSKRKAPELEKDRVLSGTEEYSGPLAAAEFARMKKEIEALRKAAHDNKKALKKQKKLIEELKSEVDKSAKVNEEQEIELQTLKLKTKKNDELISTIETTMQCQVCIELLFKPYALAPCGHVLCLTCLQEWFRKAPSADDDMDTDTENDPEYIMNRPKSCPCCRAVVVRRPVPVFIVKAVAAALGKSKGLPGNGRSSRGSPPLDVDDDPWMGLFPSIEGNGEDYDEDEDDDGEEDEGWDAWSVGIQAAFHSGSDSDEYQGEYVPTQWEPPTVDIDPLDYEYADLGPEEINMLRRGCTPEMLATYDIRYSHSQGLIVTLSEDWDKRNQIYLGWNIALGDDDDAGLEFMQAVVTDIRERPERWSVLDRYSEDGWDARKLVPVDEGEDYDTTDTEAWLEDAD